MPVSTNKRIQVSIYAKDADVRVFGLSVAWGKITVDAVVPLLQLICDNVLAIELSNTSVSCAAGCAHCCYQLIPVSAAEAVFLNKMIQAFPAERRNKARRDFQSIRDKAQSRHLDNNGSSLGFDQSYFQMGVPCPFLENNRCGIYQQRPLACREYHVNSPSQHCVNPYRTNPRRAVKGLNMAALLSAFCTHLLHSPEKIVPLYAIDKWGEDHSAAQTTFDAEWIFSKLMNGIVKAALANESIARIEWEITEAEEGQQLEQAAPSLQPPPQDAPNGSTRIGHTLAQTPDLVRRAVLKPKDPIKLLVPHASAENIRKIIQQLLSADARLRSKHPVVEIGAGDGYLSYLGSFGNDLDVQHFCAQIIETESDATIVASNRELGKATLLLKAQNLANHFGEQFTPLVISFNVLDVFSRPALQDVLAAIAKVLATDGRAVHIMSSAIHASIFMDIAESHSDKTLLPCYSGGAIGVVLVDTRLTLPSGLASFSDRPDLLPLIFKQSPEDYLAVASQAQAWIDSNSLPAEKVLLHEYSMNKICSAMERTGFVIERKVIVESTVIAVYDEINKMLGNANVISNTLGVLKLDRDEKIAKKRVKESSSFGFIVGRKQSCP